MPEALGALTLPTGALLSAAATLRRPSGTASLGVLGHHAPGPA